MTIVQTARGLRFDYSRAGRAGGRPAVLHHGLFGDAQIPAAWDEAAAAAGVELIAISRPGYGGSPPVSMSRVRDWGDLFAKIADELALRETFDVVGLSAGAPYAYALAAASPGRVGRIGILSGVPFTAEAGILDLYPQASRAAYMAFASRPERELCDYFKMVVAGFDQGFVAEHQLAAALAAISRHGYAGPAREARLQATGWGFGPADVRQPVRLWHAEGDATVPIAAAEASAARLPQAVFQRLAGDAHVPSLQTVERLFAFLAGDPYT